MTPTVSAAASPARMTIPSLSVRTSLSSCLMERRSGDRRALFGERPAWRIDIYRCFRQWSLNQFVRIVMTILRIKCRAPGGNDSVVGTGQQSVTSNGRWLGSRSDWL